jgi:hypothetical protein
MVKRILKIVMLSILCLPLIYFGAYYIQNQTLKRSYVSYNEGQGDDSFIRCNWNIIEPKFASVYFAGDEGHISFKKTKMFFQTDEEWMQSRTGGTTVKNTTFPELVKMVKEDCGQFKQPKGDFRDKTINWSYGPYTPEPEKTPEQLQQKEMLERAQEISDVHYVLEEIYTDEMRQNAIEKYGDWKDLTDDELLKWYKEGPGK